MKKNYQKPEMNSVLLNMQQNLLLGGSNGVQGVGGNAGFNRTISGGSGTARSRSFDDWDDEE